MIAYAAHPHGVPFALSTPSGEPLRWHAETVDGIVGWGLGLSGDDAAVVRVLAFLGDPTGGPLDVTPTGPSVPRDPSEELAILVAIWSTYPVAALSGELPDLTFGGPPDAVF